MKNVSGENFKRMKDIDILRELYGQRKSLEGSLQKAEMRVDDIKAELSKVNRLIGLLEEVELIPQTKVSIEEVCEWLKNNEARDGEYFILLGKSEVALNENYINRFRKEFGG